MRPTPICNGFIFKYRAAILLLTLMLAFVPSLQAEELVLEVISLQHRPAAEVLPLIQAFVAKDGVLKAADSKLIVRTTPANLAELRTLIAQLDTPPRRLLITVKQLSGAMEQDRGTAVEGQISSDSERSRIGGRIWQTEKRDNADREQQVQVVEGGEAFIDVGWNIPISDFAIEQSRSGTRMEQQTRYAAATTGFYARPRLNGETVTVEISPYQSAVAGSAAPPAFNVQALHTTVSGKIGEWMAIGGSTASVEQKDSAVIMYSTDQRGEQDRRIMLRVTVVP